MQVKLTVRTQAGYDRDIEVSATADATVADLATELTRLSDSEDGATIASAGRPLPDAALVGGPGVRSGCVLTVGVTGDRISHASSVLKLHVTGGPDAGQIISLPRGVQVIGRDAEADVVLDDPDVSRQHVELCVDTRGVSVRDLGSTNGSWLNGAAVGQVAEPLRFESLLRLGNSTLTVVGATEPPAAIHSDDSGAVLVNRPPRIQEPVPEGPVEFPPHPADRTRPKLRWLAALLPALLGVGLAFGMHNLQFLAFALLSPITMLASTASDRWDFRRSSRRERADHRQAETSARQQLDARLADEIHRRRRDFPDAAAVLQAVSTPDCRLWERRPNHPDFLMVRLGLLDQPAETAASRAGKPFTELTVPAVPATVDLTEGALGIAGPLPLVRGVARWLVGQLAALHSPRDLGIVALLDGSADGWRWLRWMSASVTQLATGPDEHGQLIAELLDEIAHRQSNHPGGLARWRGPWTVVLVDQARSVAPIPGLRTLLESGPAVGITAIFVDDDARLLPPSCRATARIVSDTGAHLEIAAVGRSALRQVVCDRVSVTWTDTVARRLSPLRDADADTSTSLPESVRLMDLTRLTELTPAALMAAWAEPSDVVTPIGVGASGTVDLDLLRDGPHVLIAGSTGSGKSELLRTLVAGLAMNHAPDEVSFVLIDYKGGAAFAECAELPHTLGLVTDLDGHLTGRALTSLEAELRRREAAFAAAGVSELAAYRRAALATVQPLPRLLLIVDEFASLADELPAFLTGLIGIAQRGRSLGVHLVLATQRPAGVVSPEIKANMALRIALRVTDPGESSDVISTDAAARISKKLPGRAIAQLASGLVEFQTARVGVAARDSTAPITVRLLDTWNRPQADERIEASGKKDLQLLADAAREASQRLTRPMPAQPWLPPLADLVCIERLGTEHREPFDVTFGLADEPAAQRQFAVRHDLANGGSIGLIGSARSGRTTALRTFLGQAARQLSHDDLHIYIMDCAGGSLRGMQALPHCGAVVTREDPASVSRLVTRLVDEVAQRQRRFAELGVGTAAEARALGLAVPAVLVAIDGWEGLSAFSDDFDSGRSVDLVLQLLRDSAAAGFTILVAGDRATLGVRTAAALTRKFLLELIDRGDYAMVGVSQSALPMHFNPGRAIAAEDGCEVQLGILGSDPCTAQQWDQIRRIAADQPVTSGPVPFAIRPLPIQVSLASIARYTLQRGEVILGVGGDEAAAVTVNLSDGDGRFLISGSARSGRSTAIVGIAAQALGAGSSLLIAAPMRSPLAGWAAEHGIECMTPGDAAWAGYADPADPAGTADLLLIDDAEQFTDTRIGDTLSKLIAELPKGSAAVATARAEDLMVSFRGPAVDVRRSRTGLLLQPSIADGELLGVRISPHRTAMPPGRGLLVTDSWRASAPNGLPIQIIGPGSQVIGPTLR
jgi:S-DNA-T family DNA segregation ATPase FtsK/SpoIIIE